MSYWILTFWPSLEVYTEQPIVFTCHLYSQFETSSSVSGISANPDLVSDTRATLCRSWQLNSAPRSRRNSFVPVLFCFAPQTKQKLSGDFRGSLINPHSLHFTWQISSAELQKISKTDIQKVTSLESCTYTQEQLSAILGSTVLSTHKCHQDSIY